MRILIETKNSKTWITRPYSDWRGKNIKYWHRPIDRSNLGKNLTYEAVRLEKVILIRIFKYTIQPTRWKQFKDIKNIKSLYAPCSN